MHGLQETAPQCHCLRTQRCCRKRIKNCSTNICDRTSFSVSNSQTRLTICVYLYFAVCEDTPNLAVGVPIPLPFPRQLSSPLQDPTMSIEELPTVFARWVSGYYPHGDLDTSLFSTMSETEVFSRFEPRPSVSPQATTDRMSPETFAKVIDIEGVTRSHMPFISKIDTKIYANNLRAALLSNVLRGARFEFVWCPLSPPVMGYASWALSHTLKEIEVTRGVRMQTFKGANHFVSLRFKINLTHV